MKSFTTTQDMAQYEVSQDYCEPYLGATHDDLQAARFNKYDTHIDKNEFFVYDDVNHKYNIYRRVEYIENTSTAYIDPQYVTNANSIIEIKIQLTATAAQNRIIGNTSGYFECYINGSSKWGFTSNGSLYVSNIAANTELHTFKIDNNALKGYIDVTQINITKNAASYYNNAYLISRNGSSTCKCKIYYSKIYNGNTLVRDFIPVKNTLTNQYGLLDTVEQKFYVSPNGVEFNGGNEIIEDKDGIQYRRKNYIQNPSNAYINTMFKPNQNTLFIIDGKYTTSKTDAQNGCYGNARFHFGLYTGSFQFGICGSGNWSKVQTQDLNRHVFQINGNGKVKIDANEYNLNVTMIQSNANIFLFSRSTSDGGMSASATGLIIYNSKIYDGTTLVRNYVPVQNISTNQYGLLDTVEQKFYISPNGIEFTGG